MLGYWPYATHKKTIFDICVYLSNCVKKTIFTQCDKYTYISNLFSCALHTANTLTYFECFFIYKKYWNF